MSEFLSDADCATRGPNFVSDPVGLGWVPLMLVLKKSVIDLCTFSWGLSPGVCEWGRGMLLFVAGVSAIVIDCVLGSDMLSPSLYGTFALVSRSRRCFGLR